MKASRIAGFVLIGILWIAGNLLIGEGPITSILFILPILALIALPFTGLLGLAMRKRFKLAFVLAFSFFLIAHYGMAILLIPLKADFDSAAQGGGVLRKSEYETHAWLDFGGSLDRIVAVRDQGLIACGFVGIGKWIARDAYPSVSRRMAYVPFAPWRLTSCLSPPEAHAKK